MGGTKSKVAGASSLSTLPLIYPPDTGRIVHRHVRTVYAARHLQNRPPSAQVVKLANLADLCHFSVLAATTRP